MSIPPDLGIDPPSELDQFWGEVICQWARLEVLRAIAGAADPRVAGKNLRIKVRADGGRKDRWALKNLPAGRGADAATKGKAARRLYQACFGFVPQ